MGLHLYIAPVHNIRLTALYSNWLCDISCFGSGCPWATSVRNSGILCHSLELGVLGPR